MQGNQAISAAGAPAAQSVAHTSGTLATADRTASTAANSADFSSTLFVFVLASFIGLGVIRGVSRLLHTPLMSLTNAISAIAVLGAILLAGGNHGNRIQLLGAVALFASTVNAVSGFLITQRMVSMFKSKQSAGTGKSARDNKSKEPQQ